MATSSSKPTWQDIERLLDELLDLSDEKRRDRLLELEEQAPDYAIAARRALDGATGSYVFESGLDGVAGKLIHDLLEKESASAVGSQLSVYRLEEVIGRGGMGIVYRGVRTDGQFQQQVAIKKIPFGLAGERGVARFQEERTILASVRHPFIAQLHDGGLDGEGLPYLVMELVDDGVRIDRFIAEQKFTEDQILELFKQVCDAVSFLHRNLITHGDIKPSNILVRPDGHPKLIDFGISRLASSLPVPKPMRFNAATPGFASPEQARGETISTQSDIYSLGATLEIILQALAEAERRTLNPDLAAIITCCKAALPENRYSTIDLLLRDIDAYLTHWPVSVRSRTLNYTAAKFLRRHWIPAIAGSLIAASLVVGIVVSTHQAKIAALEASRAKAVSEFLTTIFQQSAETLSSNEIPTLRNLVDAADDRLESDFTGAPEVKADLQVILGQAYSGLIFDPARAKSHFEAVLEYDRTNDPANIDRIMSMLHWIATTYYEEGDYVEAERLIDEAIEIDLRDGQADMVGWMTKVMLVSQTGSIEDRLGALEKAEEHYARAYGEDSAEMAVVIAGRALAMGDHGEQESSIELFQQAIDMRERHGGGSWVSTSRMRNNLGVVYHVLGRYKEAAGAYEQVLLSKEEYLGRDHSDLVGDLNNLGSLYRDSGDNQLALKHLRRSVGIAEKSIPENNFIRMAAELNYASAQINSGNPKEALDRLKNLEQRSIRSVGQDHALTAVIQRDIAMAHLDIGELELARERIEISFPKLKMAIRIALGAKIDAEIALQEGDLVRAEASIAKSIVMFNESDSVAEWMLADARLTQDRIHQVQGKEISLERHERDRLFLKETLSEAHRALNENN